MQQRDLYLSSIEGLAEQCRQAWEEVSTIAFPKEYKTVKHIVFSGMGGSALGGYVIKSLFFDSFPVPFEIVNDYKLPAYVGAETLAILASYSGETEETLFCAREAIAKGAKLTGLTTGNTLAKIFKETGTPYYHITPTHNPSNQPRMGTGYSIFGQLSLLSTLGFLRIDRQDVEETFAVLAENTQRREQARKLATSWTDRIPIIVTAEHLFHVGRVIRNQIHESAKTYADYHAIPELNHHLMEGLANPKINKDVLQFLFLESSSYSQRIQRRFAITKEVIKNQGIPVQKFTPVGRSRLAQAFECIQFGAYANYYLAREYNLDPMKIEWVDYFKAELAKDSQ